MPTFDITAPDGKQYTVDGADAQGAMAALQKHIGSTASSGVGDTAADVAKSAGIGVVKGGLGLAGMVGDLSDIGAKGIEHASNFINDKLGLERYQRPEQPSVLNNIPTSASLTKNLEGVTGELYKPKTTAGEYAQTAGEFLPAVIGGPESMAAKLATRVAVPAAVSETAGQLTKGTEVEPYARVAGALLAPGVTMAARRGVTPIQTTPERAALADALRGEGVDLTAGQATGSKPLQWMESTLGDLPGSGGRAAVTQTRQAEQFTAAALRRVGENADRATPEVIDRAFTRIGHDFDQLAARNNLHMDRQFATDLVDNVREYNSLVPNSMRSPIVENVVNDLAAHAGQNGGALTGEYYQALRSRLERAAKSSARDPQLSEALRGLRTSLDDAMERTLAATNPADLGAWRAVRNEYRNMMVIEKAATGAGSQTAEGLISPSQLRNATVVAHGRRNYARGQGDFAELSLAGEAVMKPLPNSGTAPRMYMQHLASALSGAAGGSVAGLPGAIAGAAVPATVGRALMSQPVQRYLGNRLLGPAAPGARRNEALAAALLARQGQTGPQ
jgi:hypothetical protein